jgi:hypothetical protein
MTYDDFDCSEFYLGISYKKPNAGSYPRQEVPGFYLTAGFANEGLAKWYADNRPLSAEDMAEIGAFMRKFAVGVEGAMVACGEEAAKRKHAEIDRLEYQATEIQRKLTAAREALEKS